MVILLFLLMTFPLFAEEINSQCNQIDLIGTHQVIEIVNQNPKEVGNVDIVSFEESGEQVYVISSNISNPLKPDSFAFYDLTGKARLVSLNGDMCSIILMNDEVGEFAANVFLFERNINIEFDKDIVYTLKKVKSN